MNIAKCRNCGNPISKWNYFNALYCSLACKQAFYRKRMELVNKANKKLIEAVTKKGDDSDK